MNFKSRALNILIALLVAVAFMPVTGQFVFAASKLPTPQNVTTTGKTGAVYVKWSSVKGAKKYQVYRASSKKGKYKKIKSTKSKAYTDRSVSAGKKYYYKVRAYKKVKKKKKKKKKYSSFSAPVEGMARLGGVGKLKVTVNKKGTVTATWAAKKGAAGYQLQRALADGKYKTVGTTKSLKLTDTLKESGKYVYRVRAYANVGGEKQYGAYSGAGRGEALAKARSWVGCKEKNGSHKKIINVYNSVDPASGKLGYKTPWCAAFVSAVAISTGNTGIIPVHSYCPTMLSLFEKKTHNKKYTPQGADVVFFDWNKNKVPDHVGMVEKTVGKNVTTIEGNYSDAVKRRTFKKGYSLLLAYGLPNYTISNTVSYTAPKPAAEKKQADAVDAACAYIEACEEEEMPVDVPAEAAPAEAAPTEEIVPDAETPVDVPEDAAPVDPADTDEPECDAFAEGDAADLTDMETAETIIDYIQEEAPAEEAGVAPGEESEFDAFLVYEVCDEMDIDACVVTMTEEDGTERSYNEVVLDGELYILDASEEGGVLEKYTPEEIY